ncbi:beta-ketoacyl-[acyl-carrier-protein] synthase family protein [Blastopirellula sp. J2-11]|uniref:beta-ketoacyl-[acyl-carrier-protein] synthase family protein n=1 Tax=Blastopirellula sp. J2-11 TaxID=2943192 RepID=UPI0021C99B05|nr:beta-ketoacyl-[acyl-carrier-protein] synthase family protein [Blastopirellula sp. J2-11]UUO06452.1 beta-ketoacyl-[acyl-carrier-protein] synthase family protein [Blastopirellula sp. J2-11]
MAEPVEVVITGLGVVAPTGIGAPKFWNALVHGQSGISPLVQFSAPGFPANFGGEIRDFDPKIYVKPRKSLKVMCREIQTGFSAAAMAMEQAGLEPGSVDPERLGVVYGSEMFFSNYDDMISAYSRCLRDGEFQFENWGDAFTSEINPLWMLKYLPNMPACHVGIYYDGRGHNNTICSDSISSHVALSEGVAQIRRGHVDAMIVGGTGSRVAINALMFRGDELLSRRIFEPDKASRPFDKDRDGSVHGEGAAALVLESRASAEARGAEILAIVAGDANRYAAAEKGDPFATSAVANSITAVLADAQLSAADVSAVVANGVSMRKDDAYEAAAIAATLGDVPVTAPKSMTGHIGAGCGALDLVTATMMLHESLIPPTLNYETPDPACPINVITGEARAGTLNSVVCLAQNRTGQVTAVALKHA